MNYNIDAFRGSAFCESAIKLLQHLETQPSPYRGRQKDLAHALSVGERTVTRYLRFLQSYGWIEMSCSRFSSKNMNGWVNRRQITVLEKK